MPHPTPKRKSNREILSKEFCGDVTGYGQGKDTFDRLVHFAEENHYIHFQATDPSTNVLTHVFMAHPESVKLFRTYPWFIGMNSAYKTNQYKMPFFEMVGMTPCNENFIIAYALIRDETEVSYKWLLEHLRQLIGYNVHPTAIMTDWELGLTQPITTLFPFTAHLLCTWHINKDVEDMTYKLSERSNKETAKWFGRAVWKKIVEASTVEEYNRLTTNLRDRAALLPAIVDYVEGTWLVHKEKFVRAWTNKVLHFGNTTPCKVDSAHNPLKQWLNLPTSSLDGLWIKMHEEIGSQLMDIRTTHEDSRCRRPARGIKEFHYLACQVSHYCLKLLVAERARGRSLGVKVYEQCGCVLRETHQLPCACEIRRAIDKGDEVNIQHIHAFWRTLEYGNDPPESSERDASKRRLKGLIEQVCNRDPEFQRSIAHDINEMLAGRYSKFRTSSDSRWRSLLQGGGYL